MPLLLLALLTVLSGCGILLGNVKPVTEKSDHYEVMELSQVNKDWVKLTLEEITADDPSNEPVESQPSDVAYQSNRTASIISLNSACRGRNEDQSKSLRELTDLLFLGITNITFRDEQSRSLAGVAALETTVEGHLNGEPMKLRTIVLRQGRCLYDLMFVSRPQHFPEQEQDFSSFVSSLKLN